MVGILKEEEEKEARTCPWMGGRRGIWKSPSEGSDRKGIHLATKAQGLGWWSGGSN